MIYPDRGDGRKAHYGEGKQPIDVWVEKGWAPHAYAANVVKYLRRSKDPEHSLESARYYWKALIELAQKDYPRAMITVGELAMELTKEELDQIVF